MILNFGGYTTYTRTTTLFITWRRSRRWSPTSTVCLASNINPEQLRAQLDQLHSEAEHTRAKANNARLRLMRLSEAAENLRRQAAISVETGRENYARELLFQKKKVMEALEKSKTRITLLDELSSKLNEAISVKETQLIKNVASDLDVGREDASGAVRIVSPKDEDSAKRNEAEDFDQNAMKLSEDQGFHVHTEGQSDLPMGDIANSCCGSLTGDIQNEADIFSSLKGISSFEEFMEHLDQHLNKIEAELVMILRVSTMVLDDEAKPINSKVQLTVELLESIQNVRERISSIIQTKVGGR